MQRARILFIMNGSRDITRYRFCHEDIEGNPLYDVNSISP